MTTYTETHESDLSACRHRPTLPVYRSNHSVAAPASTADRAAHAGGHRSASLQINVLLAVALAAAIVVMFVGMGGGAAANAPLRPASANSAVTDTIEVYVVQPGDTLWSIASSISPEGADLRPAVDYLSGMAGGSLLDVGQRITIDHAVIAA